MYLKIGHFDPVFLQENTPQYSLELLNDPAYTPSQCNQFLC